MTRKEIEKKITEMEAGIEELKEELKKAEDINPDVQWYIRIIGVALQMTKTDLQ